MEEKNNDGFCINVYSPGNFIAKEMTFSGPVNIGGQTANGGFSDEQVANALESIVGKDLPIDLKWKWAGAYWWLRWACNFPVDPKQFCIRTNKLPFKAKLNPPCDYDGIRHDCKLSFMEQDPRKMDSVQYGTSVKERFFGCREVALKLAEALGKAIVPPPQMKHIAL